MTLKWLILFLAIAGVFTLWASPRRVPYAGKYSKQSVPIPPYRAKKTEMRGVWVATIENIDFPQTRSAAAFISFFRDTMVVPLSVFL